MFTRRFFLRASAVAMAGVGLAPAWLVRAAAQEGRRRKILVAIFQRGAADGLNVVVPFFEPRYYDLKRQPELLLNVQEAFDNEELGQFLANLGFAALIDVL